MKRSKISSTDASLNKAFDNINSAVGSELNEIVNTIEKDGRKENHSKNDCAKVISLNKLKKKTSLASVR